MTNRRLGSKLTLALACIAAMFAVTPTVSASAQSSAKMILWPGAHLAAGGVILNLHVSVVCPAGDTGSAGVELSEAVHGVVVAGLGGGILNKPCTGADQTIALTIQGQPGNPTFVAGPAYITGSLSYCPSSGNCGGAGAKPRIITIT